MCILLLAWHLTETTENIEKNINIFIYAINQGRHSTTRLLTVRLGQKLTLPLVQFKTVSKLQDYIQNMVCENGSFDMSIIKIRQVRSPL